jgi:hypothetical protein
MRSILLGHLHHLLQHSIVCSKITVLPSLVSLSVIVFLSY